MITLQKRLQISHSVAQIPGFGHKHSPEGVDRRRVKYRARTLDKRRSPVVA